MGKIVISTNATFDGVVQDPDGAEGFRLGGWFGQFGGKDLEEWAKVEFEEALGTQALLLGRRGSTASGATCALTRCMIRSTIRFASWENGP